MKLTKNVWNILQNKIFSSTEPILVTYYNSDLFWSLLSFCGLFRIRTLEKEGKRGITNRNLNR